MNEPTGTTESQSTNIDQFTTDSDHTTVDENNDVITVSQLATILLVTFLALFFAISTSILVIIVFIYALKNRN